MTDKFKCDNNADYWSIIDARKDFTECLERIQEAAADYALTNETGPEDKFYAMIPRTSYKLLTGGGDLILSLEGFAEERGFILDMSDRQDLESSNFRRIAVRVERP